MLVITTLPSSYRSLFLVINRMIFSLAIKLLILDTNPLSKKVCSLEFLISDYMCGIKLTLFKLRLIIKKLSNVKFCTYSILQFLVKILFKSTILFIVLT